ELRRIHDALRRLLALFEPAAPPGLRAHAAPESVPLPSPPPDCQAVAPGVDGLGETRLIVVADSEIGAAQPAPETGRGYDYALAVAGGGLQALRLAQDQGCDTVLLDVEMTEGGESTSAATDGDAGGGYLQARAGDEVANAPYVVLARVQTQLALKRQKEQIRQLAEALELKNRFIQHTFGRYLSEDVVRQLLDTPAGPRLGGEER